MESPEKAMCMNNFFVRVLVVNIVRLFVVVVLLTNVCGYAYPFFWFPCWFLNPRKQILLSHRRLWSVALPLCRPCPRKITITSLLFVLSLFFPMSNAHKRSLSNAHLTAPAGKHFNFLLDTFYWHINRISVRNVGKDWLRDTKNFFISKKIKYD